MRPIVKRPLTIKLVIMYIAYKCEGNISDDSLHNICVNDCDINYFFFRQALHEIILLGYIRVHLADNLKCYSLTDKGEAALNSLIDRLSLKLRSALTDFLNITVSKENKSISFSAAVVPYDDVSFDVECKYKEGRDTLFTLKFKAGSLESAQSLAKTLENKGDKLYKSVFGTVLRLTKKQKNS